VQEVQSLTGLPGAQVRQCDGVIGAITDSLGNFQLPLFFPPDSIRICVKFPGYQEIQLLLIKGKELPQQIILSPIELSTDPIIITGIRAEQKLSESPVSVTLIDPRTIQLQSVSNIQQVLEQSNGVSIQDDQPSIRGSSGYAYGAGSRVLVMLDGLPMLSADAGFSQFDMLPVDNVKQIEIIKGSASVLYGSAALGGVINVLTDEPGEKPQTSIRIRSGVFDRPANPLLNWDGQQLRPMVSAHLYHSHRLKQFAFTVQGDVIHNPGHRQNDREQSQRIILRGRYDVKSIPGMWFGLNLSAKVDSGANFLYWSSYEPKKLAPLTVGGDSIQGQGGLTPATNTVRLQLLRRLAIDPSFTYTLANGNRHQYRSRILVTENKNNTQQNNLSALYLNEYVWYFKSWKDKLQTSVGGQYVYSTIASDSIYGDHFSNSAAAFIQADAKIFPKLNISAGWRYQWVQIDKLTPEQSPVFRAGLSYEPRTGSTFRASWGQGFRVPSIAERYTATTAGGVLVMPNPALQNEKGYTAEIGFRQGFKFKNNWKGFLDIAVFEMDFRNMIEFNVVADSVLKNINSLATGVPFRSVNVSHARIRGLEITSGFQGNLRNWGWKGSFGITLLDPKDLNGLPSNSSMNLKKDSISTLDQLLRQIGKPDRPQLLKYRNKTIIKASITQSWKNLSFTTFYRFNSLTTGIDQPLYLVVNGLESFMQKHNKGNHIADMTLAYSFYKKHEIQFTVHNIGNTEYLVVPGFIAEQRRFIVQYRLNF
jgi:iron complex outermembrane receptor protein